MREQRKKIAQETLKILQQGFYVAPSGKRIDISAAQKHSENTSRLINPEYGKTLVSKLPQADGNSASCAVINASTVTVIINESKSKESIAALNFASAKNPGGGFTNGAIAQEEALCYASGLYNTQLKHMDYYRHNRECGTTLYTDYAIYSHDVVFFRDADNRLLEEPVTCSVLTLPAVNRGHLRNKEHNRADEIMKNRMRLSLVLFASNQAKHIILGAYGCGVFKNNPSDVARWWKELLNEEGYSAHFTKITFAVMDKPGGHNIRAFEKRVFPVSP